MAFEVGTHSGTFHADDVLAFALIQRFVEPAATIVRTRDLDRLATCDIVIDVGGTYDPATKRFDHHQITYRGPRSSAGMILDWLEDQGRVTPELAVVLRDRMVDYIDAVDTGREAPRLDVPCLARVVEYLGQGRNTAESQLEGFLSATGIASQVLDGVIRAYNETAAAQDAVLQAMAAAASSGSAVVEFSDLVPWKPIYFANGGAAHPTAYILFPQDGTYKVVAIPPTLGQFEQKRPLPEAWAGLIGEALETACGVKGAQFCHKNRFIAVFSTREGALRALAAADLLRPWSTDELPERTEPTSTAPTAAIEPV